MPTTQDSHNGKIGILVGGGPAPGINSVIHSVTIEAINNGVEVFGFYDGFKHLMEGRTDGIPLTISDVSRIHLTGGSILRTSRANPTKSPETLQKTVDALHKAGVSCLVAIGGDDTMYAACQVSRHAEKTGKQIRSVHVPKTIDNDLPLPEGIPTFGFETAREVGTRLVMNLMEDALTSGQHWFVVVTMGRKAGHLALGIGKSSGATLTLIPEEWGDRELPLKEVVDILATAIVQRLVDDKSYGVALVAEGILEKMSHEDLLRMVHEDLRKAIGNDPAAFDRLLRDDYGNLRLAEFSLAETIRRELDKELKALGIKIRIVDKVLGYELRCAAPIAYDIDYTRSLGEAAVNFLLGGGNNATITLQQNQVVPILFEKMMDHDTGRTEVRLVNINSFTYRSAYKFMIRMKRQHAGDSPIWERMAAQTRLSLGEFKARYGYLPNIAPQPADPSA